jgi:hypothetical protein
MINKVSCPVSKVYDKIGHKRERNNCEMTAQVRI